MDQTFSSDEQSPIIQGAYCPLPLTHQEQIVLGHGSGGKMTHDLIRTIFQARLSNPYLDSGNDGAVISFDQQESEMVVSVDSHVVSPLFFPGGDIGRLSISGTVNDIAVMGAIPLYISAGFILEEGFQLETLAKVVDSIAIAAQEANVKIIAGDTKVVEKGKCDGLYITTSGVGIRARTLKVGGQYVKPGDEIILSGTIGDHGIAVLQARGELGFDSHITSDVAPLNQMIQQALKAGWQNGNTNAIHAMRDPTRGGVATTLCEIAQQSRVGMIIDEKTVPVSETVQSICEMLGFDPLYVANEGKCLFFVDASQSQAVLEAIRRDVHGKNAAIIGRVTAENAGKVLLKTILGSTHLLDMLSGEMLPRIC
ncbi:MAG: hydrogenase expression/formation protein HypE [Anaerolineales bacterium]